MTTNINGTIFSTVITSDQIEWVRAHYQTNTISEIADYLGTSGSTVSARLLPALGLKKPRVLKHERYRPKEKKVNGTYVNGVFFHKKISDEQIEWLRKNANRMRVTEMCKHMNMCDETLNRLLDALGIERSRKYCSKIPRTDEAEKLLRDPYRSHESLARYFGCTAGAVASKRKRMGVGVSRNKSMTVLEEKIAKILTNLDLAYKHEKYIKREDNRRWQVDFYLGRKYCIDVNGSWAHGQDYVAERDARKQDWMTQNGYKYLVIAENEIDSAEDRIIKFTQGFPPQ